jgi:hypothetical protein
MKSSKHERKREYRGDVSDLQLGALVKMDVWRSEDIAYLLTHSTQHSPS